jgi:ribose 5-phosphate isomerase B
MTQLYIASDHAAYLLKEQLKQYVATHYANMVVEDLGCDSEESVHYPYFGRLAAEKVAHTQSKAIILCGSGIGISIAANRIKGARAALCMTAEMACLARKHNDANMLALGARLIKPEQAYAMVDAFLTTAFEGGRHQLRLDMLDK